MKNSLTRIYSSSCFIIIIISLGKNPVNAQGFFHQERRSERKIKLVNYQLENEIIPRFRKNLKTIKDNIDKLAPLKDADSIPFPDLKPLKQVLDRWEKDGEFSLKNDESKELMKIFYALQDFGGIVPKGLRLILEIRILANELEELRMIAEGLNREAEIAAQYHPTQRILKLRNHCTHLIKQEIHAPSSKLENLSFPWQSYKFMEWTIKAKQIINYLILISELSGDLPMPKELPFLENEDEDWQL